MIEVRNLTKRFGPTTAVNDVSFDVPTGEVVGFLGPNGAGKTTTMRILTCYLPADSGGAKVAGYDIFENPVEVKRRIGYLPESAPVYLDMGVVEYLLFVAGMRGVIPADRTRRVKHHRLPPASAPERGQNSGAAIPTPLAWVGSRGGEAEQKKSSRR